MPSSILPPEAMSRAHGVSIGASPGAIDGQLVEQTLDRLSVEFSTAIEQLKAPIDGPRALARTTGLDVAACHRVLSGIKARGRLSERLHEWPGAVSVKRVAERVLKAQGQDAHLSPLAQAVQAYAEMIRTFGGNRTKLIGLLRAAEGQAGHIHEATEGQLVRSRRLGVRSASEVLGYCVDLTAFIAAVRPIPETPELIEGCIGCGLIGIDCRSRGANITAENLQTKRVTSDLAEEVRVTPLGMAFSRRDGILTEFSTHPLPLRAVETPGGFVRHTIDPSHPDYRGPVDVVLASHWSPANNTQYTPAPAWSQIYHARQPTKQLAMDVYLHRSMLTGAPPTVSAYHWHPGLPTDPRRHSHERLPGSPRIELLVPHAPTPGLSAWAHQPALTSRMFELAGWDRSEFVGFRFVEPYPTWGAAYFMTFDLAPADLASRPK